MAIAQFKTKKTRFKELGYQHRGDHWRVVDLQDSKPDNRPGIGPQYPTEAALKADLERFAHLYGCNPEWKPPVKHYSQMTHAEAEQAVQEAEAVLRVDYFTDVRSIAASIKEDVADKIAEGKRGEPLREWLIEHVDSELENNHNIIYTRAAQKVLLFSDNAGAYAEDFGGEGIVNDGDIEWSKLAYAAMRQDVIEQLEAEGIDFNEPDKGADDE